MSHFIPPQAARHRSALRILVLLALALLPGALASAANHYVRAGASGNGSDWTNAYGSLPTTLVRGDVYYVATGSYPGYSFDTPASGSLYITVKKATAADHGTATGWQSSYGTGVAKFGSMSCSTSYIIFDGVTGSMTSGHGFEIYNPAASASLWGFDNAPTNVTVSHVNMHCKDRYTDFNDAVYGNTPCKNIKFDHCYIHDLWGCPFLIRYWDTLTVEYCYIANNRSTPDWHAEGMSIHGSSNFTIRYNYWQNIEGTGIIMNLDAASNNWNIYGNVFFNMNQASDFSAIAHGIIGDNFNTSTLTNLRFYNNTAYNLSGLCTGLRGWASGTSMVANNNVWVNCDSVGFNQTAHSYNNYYSCNMINSIYSPGTGEISAGGQPLVSPAGLNFRLTGATAAGQTLASPYNKDMDGKTRGGDGSWDRGAFEFGGTTPIPTVTPTPTPRPTVTPTPTPRPTVTPTPAPSNVHYVRAGATGNGTDWANAYGKLPATLLRGHTYFVADGTYPGYTFNTAVSGSTYITVKKATAANHGTATGWQAAYGDGVATFGPITCTTSYIIFDGVTGSGKSGHGFEIYSATSGMNLWRFENAPTNVTISHANIHFASRTLTPQSDAIYGNTPCKNITVSYCYIHDTTRCPLLMRNWVGLMWDHNWTARNCSTSAYHSEGVSSNGGGNFVFRYSTWEDIEGTAIIVNLTGATDNWQIYGNTFFTNPGSNAAVGMGIVCDNFSDSTYNSNMTNIKFFNNSAYNLSGYGTGCNFWSAGSGSGNVAYDNLWYNCKEVAFWQCSHDFNTFNNCTFATPSYNTGGFTRNTNEVLGSGDPYVSCSGANFRLKAATAAGKSLSSPYNLDPTGKTRGSDGRWDRGAYEFGGATPNPTPTPTPQPISNVNLVAAYNCNEGSGTTLIDRSGHGNNGTLSGGVLWTTYGRFGGALQFNGTSSRVIVKDSASLDLTSQLTIEAWVIGATSLDRWRSVVIKEGAGKPAYSLYANNSDSNTPYGSVTVGGLERAIAGGAKLPLNAWQHLAMTYDGATIRLYVNGAQVSAQPQTGALQPSTGVLSIGGNGIWNDEFFQGRIDQIRIYNKALTAAQIATDMNAAM